MFGMLIVQKNQIIQHLIISTFQCDFSYSSTDLIKFLLDFLDFHTVLVLVSKKKEKKQHDYSIISQPINEIFLRKNSSFVLLKWPRRSCLLYIIHTLVVGNQLQNVKVIYWLSSMSLVLFQMTIFMYCSFGLWTVEMSM